MSDNPRDDRPDRFSVKPAVVDGVLVVTVYGEIDHDVKNDLAQALISADGTAPPRIVVDLSGVTFMDSSGINVFIAAHRRVSEARGGCASPAPRSPSCV
ncbi:STAS domain-containing protein [Streptomyces sp. NBC_00289]|uniref:STAS domain-containing protein n=1 Tax=Streptomyces sp. NBC_00289 TaxID=2975703 RepID=UPI00352E70D7